ncbi:surface-adhesin E family protein [Thauera phenylacetica]
MKRLLALLCCAAVSVPAMAADWEVFSKDEKLTVYYSPSTVRKGKNVARAWVLVDYVELQVRILGPSNHKAYSSRLELIEFDCADPSLTVPRHISAPPPATARVSGRCCAKNLDTRVVDFSPLIPLPCCACT